MFLMKHLMMNLIQKAGTDKQPYLSRIRRFHDNCFSWNILNNQITGYMMRSNWINLKDRKNKFCNATSDHSPANKMFLMKQFNSRYSYTCHLLNTNVSNETFVQSNIRADWIRLPVHHNWIRNSVPVHSKNFRQQTKQIVSHETLVFYQGDYTNPSNVSHETLN